MLPLPAMCGICSARLPSCLSSALPPNLQVCSLAGGLLNVLRVPERWLQPADPAKPAPLDYALNSHQVGAGWVDATVQRCRAGICCCCHQG